jgi:type I restriction enzyme S subunit
MAFFLSSMIVPHLGIAKDERQMTNEATRGRWKPYPAYKPSGVEWLGEIPSRWETLLLKRTANIRYGLGQPPPEMIEGAPLIRATNIKSGHIFDEGMIYVDPAEVPARRNAVLSEGEIIVVRSGAYTGDSAIIPAKYSGAISGYDLVVTIREGYSPFFAWQFLCPAVRDLQFIPSSLRAAQPHLNAEELAETVVIVPPIPGQQAIAVYLDRETAKLDALIARVRQGIEKLREYRAALISAAVTGKIDVRGSL